MFKALATRVLQHIIAQNSWANAMLQPFAGLSVAFNLAAVRSNLVILEDGILALAGETNVADASIHIPLPLLLRLLAKDEAAIFYISQFLAIGPCLLNPLQKKLVVNHFVLIPAEQPYHDLRLRIYISFSHEFFIMRKKIHNFACLCCGIQCFAPVYFICKNPGMTAFYPVADIFIEKKTFHAAKVTNAESCQTV